MIRPIKLEYRGWQYNGEATDKQLQAMLDVLSGWNTVIDIQSHPTPPPISSRAGGVGSSRVRKGV